jgi:lipoprotein-releasing system permease protein
LKSPHHTNERLLLSIAWRFLSGRGSRLLDGTARAALIASVLGVTAMVIAMALMSGYREDLRRKLVRGNAAVIAYPLSGQDLDLADLDRQALEAIPEVTDVRPVIYGQGSLVSGAVSDGIDVTLRGIESTDGLEGLGEVRLTAAAAGRGMLSPDGMLLVVLGEELASRLAVQPDEILRLMVLGVQDGRPKFRYRSARLGGTFRTGFSEFDQSWAVTDRATLEQLIGSAMGSGLYEIALGDPSRAELVAEQARTILGADYLITHWRDLNRELFTALKVQQIALFFVLGLIVVVATFNVASSLVVLVRERMRDIGVLAALGLAPRHLRAVFLLYGAGLGLAGTLGGLALGSAISWVLTEFELIRFGSEMAAIYFISSVPFRVELDDLLAVAVFALLVTLLACWFPARRAGRVLPARALRYE